MAEEAGSVALVAVDQLGEAASASTEWKESWEVEFSRFFNFPTVSSDSFASHSLKPMARYKTRVGGTWVTASSQARLQLVRLRADVDPVISVSIRGTTIEGLHVFNFFQVHQEEHFISNISISWPQVSCASECPTRGSRVVFFSYIGSSGQTHKFATRFNASSTLQDFLDNIEKIYNNKVVRALPCEDPTASDQIGSNRLQLRSGEESGFSKPSSPYTPELPVLSIADDESRCSLQPLFADDVETFSGVPPTFTELLTECSTQIAQRMTGAGGSCRERNTEKDASSSPLHDSLNAISVDDFLTSLEQLMLAGEADLKSQIEECLADASFRDMLAKIERVVNELGGESAALSSSPPRTD